MPDSKNLTVSVVIPTYNEEASIARTIMDIQAQEYEGKVEIIVSDNNSTDQTPHIAQRYHIKFISEKRKGTRFNYDTGMRAATGDIIILTNADVVIPKGWISSIVAAYKDPTVVGVGTRVKFYSVPSYVNLFLRFLDIINPMKTMWGPSLSCRREAFYAIGGMDHGASVNEDAVFTLKLKKLGRVKILPKPVVLMDGRRFNKGLANNVREWIKGFGLNSLIIQFRYWFTGKAVSKKVEFRDIRDHSTKLPNKP